MAWINKNSPSSDVATAPTEPSCEPQTPDLARVETMVPAIHAHDGSHVYSPMTYENNELAHGADTAELTSRGQHLPHPDSQKSHHRPKEVQHLDSRQQPGSAPTALDSRAKTARAHFVAVTGEFLGTFFFLWCSLAGTSYVVNTSGDPSTNTSAVAANYYASVVFSLSLLANVWVFYRISGGLFNPAVTLGLVVSGKLPWIRGLLYCPTQIIAAVVASALVQCMFPGPLSGVTKLSNGTSVAQGFFIEVFLTAMLTKAVLMLAGEKHKATYLAPVGIGLAFFAAELVGIPYTGGSLNPARSFGPDAANASFEGYHWIYWLGPLLGALLASGYDRMARVLKYREANPGQDAAHPDEPV